MGFIRRPLLALLLLTVHARAADVALIPADTQIELTVFTMGVFPQTGHFGAFTGTLHIEPGDPQRCHVAISVNVASLRMSTDTGTHLALGPPLLDAAHYPSLAYEGSCQPGSTAGNLTLHGITHPLALTATRSADRITARGTLRRQDYAIQGMPGLVGNTIRIIFSVDLPPDLAQELPH